MKYKLLSLLVVLLVSMQVNAQKARLNYIIDLNDRSDDTFKVELIVDGKLAAENNVYQFASTAPGTYQTMDIGRYVSDFRVFDKKGREIESKKINENQWLISNPQKVRSITYEIAETWDTPVIENPVYQMAGTSIEDDHALINVHAVLGYPKGMQKEALSISIERPSDWKAGSAMDINQDGSFYAKDYDFAVDSPILLGRLSYAATDLNGSKVEIYTYSKTDLIKSEQLLQSMSEMLKSAEAFMIDFPVDRYTFLYHFEDLSAGAWEHSYSSEYVLAEEPFTDEFGQGITDISAHEFFHVVTPLNIHSEIVQYFNYETPTPSEHLWLYEGTTEWAAHMMQLRYGLTDLDQYFAMLSEKMLIDSHFDPSYSLSQLALNSYTKEGQTQYANIYMRGALVAGLLDILLLEKSDGKKGYREVIYELSQKYGPDKPFDDVSFIQEFVSMTYPEVGEFFENYVRNANPLPMKEFYAKLGIKYIPEIESDEVVPDLGGVLGVPDGKIRFLKLREENIEKGLKVNDELIAVNGKALSLQNVNQLLMPLMQMPIGGQYTLTVRRGVEEIDIPLEVWSKKKTQLHVFKLDENASEEAERLREIWSKNM